MRKVVKKFLGLALAALIAYVLMSESPVLAKELGVGIARDGRLVYHPENCTRENNDGKLVFMIPGTDMIPIEFADYVKSVGDASGLCVLSSYYFSAFHIGQNCCVVWGAEGGATLDPACSREHVNAKTFGGTVQCLPGNPLEKIGIPHEESLIHNFYEGLKELQLKNYYDNDASQGIVPHWDSIVLAGFSQGAVFATYLGMDLYPVKAIAQVGGGAPAYFQFYEDCAAGLSTCLTPPTKLRETHHIFDLHTQRMSSLLGLGVPRSNIKVSSKIPHRCLLKGYNFHYCSVLDPSSYLEDWLWTIGEDSAR